MVYYWNHCLSFKVIANRRANLLKGKFFFLFYKLEGQLKSSLAEYKGNYRFTSFHPSFLPFIVSLVFSLSFHYLSIQMKPFH